MALRSFNQIGRGQVLMPDTEIGRFNYATANRRLFAGDFRELGITQTAGEVAPLRINWFRRVATFYPEMMFAERPTVTIEGNERAHAEVNPLLPASTDASVYDWWRMLEFANTDMLRFGMGIIASDPDNPLSFVRFEPDSWYEVIDGRGEHLGDICIRRRPRSFNEDGRVDVYRYPIDDSPSWQIYQLEGDTIGNLLETMAIPSRLGRQVRTLTMTIDNTSIFDNMKPSVASMSKDVARLDRTLERNSNPHLFGPEGMLPRNTDGSYQINPEGMFFPLEEDDQVPGYAQWKSDIEALEWDFNNHERTALVQAGLSPLLFDPAQETNALSGVSLRRTLMPTWARLLRIKESNDSLIRQMILLWNANRRFVGLEVFDIEAAQIRIDWPFMVLFEDITDGSNDDGGAGE